MATKAAAIPAAVLKKARRLMPRWRASSLPYSLIRASNSRCFAVCGAGMNSSLDTDWVGIGAGKADVSAGNNCFSSSELNKPITIYLVKVGKSPAHESGADDHNQTPNHRIDRPSR